MLILIVIAIIGAVAVGLILSTTSHSVGNQAANNGNGSSATQQLLIGGSTTLFPADEAAIKPFQAAYPAIKVVDAQGGSDAGMQGILSGALDIGAASSISAVNALYNAVANNQVYNVQVNPTLVGGSGVVFGTTSLGTATSPGTGSGLVVALGAMAANPLYDSAVPASSCLEISRTALATMYALGTFYIATGGCSAGNVAGVNVLDAACVVATAATGTAAGTCEAGATLTAYGPFAAISRSDFGGTEDTACGYLKNVGGLSYTSGSGVCGGSFNIGSGNLGVLTNTQTCNASQLPAGVKGCVGFFDFGFGEGKSAQAASTCPAASGSKPCNVFIVEVTSLTGGSTDTLQESTAGGAKTASSYAFTTDSVANIDTFIKSALKTAATQNPQTLQYSQISGQTFFPDAGASGASNPLDRTFYYVTNGTPTSAEQDWISFMTNYNAETYWLGAGYYSQYDFTSA